MALINKEMYDMPDKLSNVKAYIRRVLSEKRIIDEDDNILDIPGYIQLIGLEIDKRVIELNKNSNNGVIIDREKASILFGELEFLNDIKDHRLNLNYLIEHPVKPMIEQDRSQNKSGLFGVIKQFRRRIMGKNIGNIAR